MGVRFGRIASPSTSAELLYAYKAKPNGLTFLPACVLFRKLVAAISQKQW